MSSGVKIGRKAVVFVLSAIMAFTFGMGDVSMAWAAQSSAGDQGAQKQMQLRAADDGEWWVEETEIEIEAEDGDDVTMEVPIGGDFDADDEGFTYLWYNDPEFKDNFDPGEYTHTIDNVYGDSTWYCDVSRDGSDPVTVTFYITISGGEEEINWYVPEEPVKYTVQEGSDYTINAFYYIYGDGFDEYDFEYYWYQDGEDRPEDPGEAEIEIKNVTDQQTWNCDVVYYGGDEEETKTIQFIVSPISWYIVADRVVTYTKKDIDAGRTSITLKAEVRGLKDGETPIYRWQKEEIDEDGDPYDADIPGATEATYEAPLEPGKYCINVAVGDTNTWHGQYIEVRYDTHFAVSNEPNEEVLVDEGEDAVLTVDASNDLDEINYVWEKEVIDTDGDPVWDVIEEETSKSLTVANVTEYARYRCTASDAGNNLRTINFIVSVKNGFTAEAETGGKNIWVYPEDPVTLHVLTTAKQTEPLNFKWYYNCNEEDGWDVLQEEPSVTGDTWYIPDVSEIHADEYYFKCVVTDKYGYSKTVEFKVEIDNELEIHADNNDVTAPKGSPATLEVYATAAKGKDNLTYEWHKAELNTEEDVWEESGDAIEGATDSTYTVESVDAYEMYRCTVKDEYGNNEDVLIYVHPDTGLVLNGEEYQDIGVNLNETATLEVPVTANEGEVLTYEWEKDEESLDEDGASLTTEPLTQSTQYWCRVSDQYGYYTNVWFDVYVNAGWSIDYDIDDVYVDLGGDVELSVPVKGGEDAGLQYRWYDGDYNPLPGATAKTLTLENVTKSEEYICKITDSYGNSEWPSIKVFVNNRFTVRANGTTFQVKPGDDQLLQVEAFAANGDLTYTWYKLLSNGEKVRVNPQDKDEPNKYLVKDFNRLATEYSCEVKDEYGNTKTMTFNLYLYTGINVTYDDDDFEVAPGTEVKLKVTPTSEVAGNTYRYKWFTGESDHLIPSYDEDYSGATTNELTIKAANKTENYQCLITDEYGTECYAYFYVEVQNHLEIGEYEDNVDIAAGSSAPLTVPVTADDMDGMQYSWEASLDDGSFPSDEELTGKDNPNTNTIDAKWAGWYYCEVTDKYGNHAEASFLVTVNGGLKLSYNESIKMDPGDTVTLQINATTQTPENLEYTWYLPTTGSGDYYRDIVKTTTGEYEYTPVTGGTVDVEVTDGYNKAEAHFYFDIESGLEASAEQTDVVVQEGEEAVLKVNAHTNAPNGLTYEWQDNATDDWIRGVTGDTYRFTPNEPGEYTCWVDDGFEYKAITFTVRFDTGLKVTAMDSGKAETEVSVLPGEPLTLEVKTSGGNGHMLTYQWYYAYRSWQSGDPIEGATNATFTVRDPMTCEYYCIVSDGQDRQKATINVKIDTEFTAQAYYKINSGTKTLLDDESAIEVQSGDQLTMIIEASNNPAGGTITYGWQQGDGPVVDGTNESTITVTKDTTINAWVGDDYNSKDFNYHVVIKQACQHKNLTKTNAKAAGCTTDGNIEYWTCNDCGKLFSDANAQNEITLEDTVIKAAHKLTHVAAKAPTCEAAGNIEYWTCSVCGEAFADEAGTTPIEQADTVVAATGHDWGEWEVTKPATETEEGEETRTCKNDPSHKETRPIPMIGHVHSIVAVAAKDATCEEAGNTAYWKCEGCGHLFSDAEGTAEINQEDTVIKALGHDWGEWEVTTEATCTKAGEQTRVCKRDPSHVEKKTIARKDHTLTHVEAVAPTEEAAGNIEYWKCEQCGKYFADEAGTEEISAEDVVIGQLISLEGATVAKIADKVYTGKQIKPAPTVTKDGVKLVKDTDYTLAYKNNTKAGKATVTITGAGSYTGTLTKTFKINPKKAAFTTVTVGKKKMTVKAKTAVSKTGGTTYQIWYKVKGTSTWKKTTSTKQSKVIKSLKKGKKYQVKIRAIKKVGTTTYYGAWSVIKTTAKIK